MKKLLFPIALLSLVAVSCDKTDDLVADQDQVELKVLTFEDVDYNAGANITGASSWSSLIDSPEYYGSLLYSETEQYTWADTNNTYLSGEVSEGMDYYTSAANWMFWTGGIAVSNYYCAVVSGTEVDYTRQLSVSNGSAGAAGNNGSANFAVVNDGAAGGYGSAPYLSFGDETARIIDHLYISSTSYLESAALDGNYSSSALGADDNYTITATGYDIDGVETGTAVYELAKDGALVSGWNKWDLSGLGEVVKVKFSISSSVENSWGMSLPTNFAIDDIAVRF